jgi:ribosomal protein S18 acetylase RimI-like enzyme
VTDTGISFRPYQDDDQAQVIALWRACGLVVPQNDPATDISRKLQEQRRLFLVGVLDSQVVATAMAGYEGHRGWVYYLAVDPRHQRKGIGRRIMAEVERLLLAEGCPKINLMVRQTNQQVIAFYEKIGFSIDPVVAMGKRLVSP